MNLVKVFTTWPSYYKYPIKVYTNAIRDINEAEGVVCKFYSQNANKVPIGYEVYRMIIDQLQKYETLWVHLGKGYYKQVIKIKYHGNS